MVQYTRARGRAGRQPSWYVLLTLHEPPLIKADFLIDISSVDNRDPEKEEVSSARVNILVDAWKSQGPELAADLQLQKEKESSTEILSNSVDPEGAETAHLVDPEDQRRPGFWRQTRVLTGRSHRSVYRNVPQLVGYLVQAVLLGVIIGVTYYRLPEVRHMVSTGRR